jgi:hypothetical protein
MLRWHVAALIQTSTFRGENSMKAVVVILLLMQTNVVAWADNQADREQLEGTWVEDGNAHPNGWTISKVPGGLHIAQTADGRTIASFDCPTSGRDCDVKVDGHKATVSMYFNGAALVMIETRNDKVVKRRFSLMPSPDAMKLEIMPMSGGAQIEEVHFRRQNATEAQK